MAEDINSSAALNLLKATKQSDSSFSKNAIVSGLAGVVSGAIQIPKGVFSLGAELIDLGFDTNAASRVEEFFDKINPFEEVAKETTTGKITEALTQIGIPGVVGYRIGSQIASRALDAKKTGKYFNLSDAGKKVLGGALGSAAAEATVTDDDIGSLGDLIGGPTQFDRTEGLLGRDEASRRLLNRLKIGVESPIIAGGVGLVGSAAKTALKAGETAFLNASPIVRATNKIIDSLTAKGAFVDEEGFRLWRESVGSTRADISFGAEIATKIDDFANLIRKGTEKAGLKLEPEVISQEITSLLKSGVRTKEGAEAVTELAPEAIKKFKDFAINQGKLSGKQADELVATISDGRNEIDRLSQRLIDVGANKNITGELVKTIEGNIGEYLTRSYKAFEVKGIKGIFKKLYDYVPGEELKKDASNFLISEKSNLIKNFKELRNIKDITERTKAGLAAEKELLDFAKEKGIKTNKTEIAKEIEEYLTKQDIRDLPNITDVNKKLEASQEVKNDLLNFVKNKKIKIDELDIDNELKDYLENGIVKEKGIIEKYLKFKDERVLAKYLTPLDQEGANKIVNQILRLDEVVPGLKNIPDDQKFSIALGKVSQGILTKRKNVPAEIRALLGEIKDPAYNVSNSISKLANLVHRTKFYNDIHDLGFTGKVAEGKTTGRFIFTDIEDARNYYQSLDPNIQFNADQFKSFTKLKEKYGKEQIAFKLENMIAPKAIVDAIEETYTTIGDGPYGLGNLYKNFILLPKGVSQVAKTVYSAFTHARNLISGGAFSAANGNFSPLTFNNKDEFFKEVFGDEGLVKSIFANKPTLETANRLRELGRLGVFNTNVSLNEIRQLFLQEFKTPEQLQQLIKTGAPLALKKFQNISQFAQKLYQKEDDLWKGFNFAAERGKYSTILKNAGINADNINSETGRQIIEGITGRNFDELSASVLNTKQLKSLNNKQLYNGMLDEISADIVRNTVPNYDYVGSFVKTLRLAPLGNFMSFPAEIIRTGYNTLTRGYMDIQRGAALSKLATQTGNEALARAAEGITKEGYKRVISAGLVYGGVPLGTAYLAQKLTGTTDEEMDALRRFVPKWSKNSTLVPTGRTKDGNLTYIDFSFANPYDTLLRPFQTVVNALRDGKDEQSTLASLGEAGFQSIAELTKPFFSESIYAERLLDSTIRRGRNVDGRRIYNEEDPIGTKISKSLLHVVDSFTPGSTSQIGRLIKSSANLPDEYGKSYNLLREAPGIFGFRSIEVNPVDSMKYMVTSFNNRKSDARNLFTSEALKGGVISPNEVLDLYQKSEKARFDVFREMNKNVNAAKVLGATSGDLAPQLKRISKTDRTAIETGRYQPYDPSEEVRDIFRQNALKLGVSDPYIEALPRIKAYQGSNKNISLTDDKEPNFSLLAPVEEAPAQPVAPAQPNLINIAPPTIPQANTLTPNIPASTQLKPPIPTSTIASSPEQRERFNLAFNNPGDIVRVKDGGFIANKNIFKL